MTNCSPDLFTDLDGVELPRLRAVAGPRADRGIDSQDDSARAGEDG